MISRQMKKIGKGLERYLNRKKMSERLMLSYFVPTVLVSIMLTFAFVPYMHKQYRSKNDQNVEQSLEQADSFIEQYISDMYYIEELMEADSDLNDVLKQTDLQLSMDDRESYRQYWQMITAVQTMEAADYRFRISIYFPDPVLSLTHKYYFHTLSELRDLDTDDEFYETVMSGKVVFMEMEDYLEGSTTETSQFICMLRKYDCLEDDYSTRRYIFRVQIEKEEFLDVLNKAAVVDHSFAYLVNKDGKILAGSGEAADVADVEGTDLPLTIGNNWSLFEINGKKYYGLRSDIASSNLKLILMIPRREYLYQSSILAGLLTLVILSIEILVFLISRRLSLYYGSRLSLLNQKMKEVENGNLTVYLNAQNEKDTGDEIDEIYGSFNQMTARIRQLMKEEYRLGKEVTRTELKVLQAQINPHFLYNTLDLINWGAMDYGATEVAKTARDLGTFYRMSLNHGKSIISIRNELKHVQAYVNIENVHFDGRVNLFLDVPEELMDYGCLNIILQPFVENSILHGMAEHPEITDCEVRISIREEKENPGNLIFTISDNGPGIPPEKLPYILQSEGTDGSHGYGVKNINFRIRLCFGENYGVSYHSVLGQGTDAYVRLPKKTCEELEEMI